MRRFRAWGLAAALVASAAPPAGGGEPAKKEADVRADDRESAPWYRRLFGGSDKKPQAKAPAAKPKEVAAKTLAEEQAAFLQRLAVCTRLRELAVQNGDDAMLNEAEELEKQATELYHRKVAHLPSSRLTPLGAGAEAALDRRLGSGVSVDPTRASKKPTPRDARASAKREEMP